MQVQSRDAQQRSYFVNLASRLACLLSFLILAAALDVQAQSVGYLPLGTSGYDSDIVAESQPAATSTNTTVDGAGHAFYAAGYRNGAPTSGLPVSRSIALANRQFELQPALRLQNNTPNTLTLGTAGRFSALSVAAVSDDGSSVVTVQMNFTDGTTAASTITIFDWYGPLAMSTGGYNRTLVTADQVDIDSNYPRIYMLDVPIPTVQQGKSLASVTFTKTNPSSARTYVLAISAISATAPVSAATVAVPGLGLPQIMLLSAVLLAGIAYFNRRAKSRLHAEQMSRCAG